MRFPIRFSDKSAEKFAHPQFPIYLVTRLAAYDFEGIKGLVDRSLQAANRGKFVIDLRSSGDGTGDDWLRDAAIKIPKERLMVDESTKVLYDQTRRNRLCRLGIERQESSQRFLGFHWLPGAIMTEFVSTDGRTFARPPENWNISDWGSPKLWFAGSPQTMTADYIQEGVTGASGHVDEPYLSMCPRPICFCRLTITAAIWRRVITWRSGR